MKTEARQESPAKRLEKVREAAKALQVSKEYLYKLPAETPGVYGFGRAKRFDIEELRAWASGK